jgi:hemerythrin-like domain-containing protein
MLANEPKNARALLEADHRSIDALLLTVVTAVRADDRDAAAKAWTSLEVAVLRHFDIEEMFVFPALASAHGVEVEGLKREHDEIRCLLGEISLAFDLHTVRCATVEDLCSRLRDHAQREEALAYVEADRKMHLGAVQSVFERLKRFAGSLPLENVTTMGDQP